MIVLGIETSCDETGLAIYDFNNKKLLSETLHSQINLHSQYGGVVPELASRDHVQKIIPLYKETVKLANLDPCDIKAIAYTSGPGLVGALMVGASFAKGLSYALDIPSIAVHHLEGHILAPLLSNCELSYPFITLLVSGGHTQLILVKQFGHYELMGESVDDAVGESFDKTAKMLGLSYPGGPELAKLAEKGQDKKYIFPRPMIKKPGLNFSFSGLKTAVLTEWNKSCKSDQVKFDICLGFEQAVVDTLLVKCSRAIELSGVTRLVVAGGVSANKRLRTELSLLAENKGWEVQFPSLQYCTDNGAMIALAGAYRLKHGFRDYNNKISVVARWPLNQINL